ncbi:MAG: hypothetical protein NUV80_06410 [Candidatus Berkelbacteria bacterium]|nr:hypothetical protein [Candidatus Berkelbacteria bacterium]
MSQLPDKMTGADLVLQEEHELQVERNYFNRLDRVDRRDKRGEITSFVASPRYRLGYDQIDWNTK